MTGVRAEFLETEGLLCKNTHDVRPKAIGALLVGKDLCKGALLAVHERPIGSLREKTTKGSQTNFFCKDIQKASYIWLVDR